MSLECLRIAPNYYKITLHIIGGLSVPINALGIFLIMRHSAKKSSYKYCQLYVQLLTMFVELHMSWICPGYYYFPLLGGINTNYLTVPYIPTHASVVVYYFTFAFELPSIVTCFVHRHEAAAEMNTSKRIPRFVTYFVLISSHSFPFVVAALLLKSQLIYEQKKHILTTYYPTCLHLLDMINFEVYDWRVNHYTLAVGFVVIINVLFFYSYALFLAIQTLKILQIMRKRMSRATYKMHLTAIITLVCQWVCPFIFICLPILIILYVVIFEDFEKTALATNTMFMITAHSMMSTITIIACNSKFREVIITLSKRVCRCDKFDRSSLIVKPLMLVVRSITV